MNLILSLILILISFVIFYFYKKWKRFKFNLYRNENLKPWDYTLFISYWFLIILSVICSAVFLSKEF